MKLNLLKGKILPVLLSVTLALSCVTPAVATQTDTAFDASVQAETTTDTENDTNVIEDVSSSELEDSTLTSDVTVSDNTTSADTADTTDFSEESKDTDETEADDAVYAETEGTSIEISFCTPDEAEVIYGPITKDLSVLSDPTKGRYLFDQVKDGVSVYDVDAFNVMPYIYKGRKISKWTRKTNGSRYSYDSLKTKALFAKSDTLSAIYENRNYSFTISYDLDGGAFDSEDGQAMDIPYSFTVDSDTLTLPTVYKKGFVFDGWEVINPSAKSAYQTTIKSIPSGTYIDYNYGEFVEDGCFPGYSLKAKYTAITVGTPVITSLKNPKTGDIAVSIAPNASEKETVSYELSYSNNKKFSKTTTHVIDLGTKKSYKITNAPKGKTYYVKVRAYKKDFKGTSIYSSFSPVKNLKVNKGVTESKKITKSSAKLSANNVKIDGNQNLYVQATCNKRLKSSDDFYYLVSIDPNTGKILKSVASSDKNKKVIFKTPVRTDNGINLINGKYALAVKTGKNKYKQISSAYFIKNPEGAADYTAEYPITKSKKGIQGSTNTELGVQQGFTNFSINSILADGTSGTKYVYNGKTYYFNEPWGITSYASSCNSAGITCSVQIMMNWPGTGKYKDLLFGTKSSSAPYNLYAINASTPKSRELVEAAFSFLADRCSREDCHVDNWILGNEVNIYKQWYYAGSTGYDAFMKNYAATFRILYNSVKGRNKNAHIFICTDHTWKNRDGDWGAKPFMESFHSQIKAMNKNIQWNLAYHAYPSILFMPATWRDSYAPNSENADFVSPKNLNVLTNYVKNTYGKNTRIIISECGFTNAEGEATQAAALAYSFYKAQFDDMIDAFIIRTEFDAPGEKLTKYDGSKIDAGFGLRTTSGTKRASYDVFKYMDTPQYAKYTAPCLKTIGASNWNSIIPGFNDKTLKNMPNR